MTTKKELSEHLEIYQRLYPLVKDERNSLLFISVILLIGFIIILFLTPVYYINIHKSKIIPQKVCVNDSRLYACNKSGMIMGIKIEYNKEIMDLNLSACQLVKETIKNCSMQKEVCEDGICQVRYRK